LGLLPAPLDPEDDTPLVPDELEPEDDEPPELEDCPLEPEDDEPPPETTEWRTPCVAAWWVAEGFPSGSAASADPVPATVTTPVATAAATRDLVLASISAPCAVGCCSHDKHACRLGWWREISAAMRRMQDDKPSACPAAVFYDTRQKVQATHASIPRS
jgi:hypothetical protein